MWECFIAYTSTKRRRKKSLFSVTSVAYAFSLLSKSEYRVLCVQFFPFSFYYSHHKYCVVFDCTQSGLDWIKRETNTVCLSLSQFCVYRIILVSILFFLHTNSFSHPCFALKSWFQSWNFSLNSRHEKKNARNKFIQFTNNYCCIWQMWVRVWKSERKKNSFELKKKKKRAHTQSQSHTIVTVFLLAVQIVPEFLFLSLARAIDISKLHSKWTKTCFSFFLLSFISFILCFYPMCV